MFFSLILYHTVIFAFVVYVFGVIFKKSFQILMSTNFFLCFLIGILDVTFKSICYGLIFVSSVREKHNLIILYMNIQFSPHFIEDVILIPLSILDFFVKYYLTMNT